MKALLDRGSAVIATDDAIPPMCLINPKERGLHRVILHVARLKHSYSLLRTM
jgi:hypothetical protein